MTTQKRLHETISAMADSELAAAEVELAVATLATSAGRAAWNTYHQIGHTLRSDLCGFELSDGFSARMASRLASESRAALGLSGAHDDSPDAPVPYSMSPLP